MEWVSRGLEMFLGLQFLVFGLDGIFHFLPTIPQAPGVRQFVEGLEKARFVMPTVKVIEVLTGTMLLLGWKSFWAMTLLSPLIYNIVGIHLVHNREKSWVILLQVLLPYTLLLACLSPEI